MKHVVSVSLGSSRRNHRAEINLMDEEIIVERMGTDGDLNKALELIRKLDGKVSAFGMGGIDLYIWCGKHRYIFREAKKLASAARHTPIVDGSGLKNTLERKVVTHLWERNRELFHNKNVLMVSAMDRFGMAEALLDTGCKTLYGDLIFALGLPIPLYSLRALNRVARILAPIVVQLPFKMIYPTGKKQEQNSRPKFQQFYQWADVITGDFHMIKKHLPEKLSGKTIITNTVTKEDVALLQQVGISRLVTTTPNIGGRSFGTNVMEALIVALLNKPIQQVTSDDYLLMLDKIEFQPRIEEFFG